MGVGTSIEWTTATWNPLTGCTKISPGCAHCLGPDTLVLMSDWTSRRISDLREGDTVVAFDEGTSGVGVNKVYEKAIVERVWWSRKPAVRIATDDGGTIIASTDHLFLKPPRGWFKAGNARVLKTCFRRVAYAEPTDGMSEDYCAGYLAGATDGDGTMRERQGDRPYREQQWYWRVAVSGRQTEFIDRLIECAARFGICLERKGFDSGLCSDMIKVETRRCDEIATLSTLWNRSGIEFSRGYLAGIFDAEGSFGKNGGSRPGSLRVSNTQGALLDAIVSHGKTAGFQFKIENFHGRHCKTARLYGSLDEIGRFLGLVRPALTYKKQAAFGCRIDSRSPRVIAVEYLGERDLVDIQTSARTFIANGYMTHNCYAERMSHRLRLMGQPNYANGFDLTLHERMLDQPLKWKKPQSVFVNSMSDLFHTDVPVEFIRRVFDTMQKAHWHQFQVLTKRADRLEELSPRLPWPDNVWQGVSVENADYAFRIDHLRRTGAKTKFLSIEPLLGPLPDLDLTGIDWAIIGGESGPGARPVRKEWITDIIRQCEAANVPVFFKQWGGTNKKKAGRELDGRTYDGKPRPLAERINLTVS